MEDAHQEAKLVAEEVGLAGAAAGLLVTLALLLSSLLGLGRRLRLGRRLSLGLGRSLRIAIAADEPSGGCPRSGADSEE